METWAGTSRRELALALTYGNFLEVAISTLRPPDPKTLFSQKIPEKFPGGFRKVLPEALLLANFLEVGQRIRRTASRKLADTRAPNYRPLDAPSTKEQTPGPDIPDRESAQPP